MEELSNLKLFKLNVVVEWELPYTPKNGDCKFRVRTKKLKSDPRGQLL